jgi:CelD/BcsL family acetyltransferase involved in cellulose biosynthesis
MSYSTAQILTLVRPNRESSLVADRDIAAVAVETDLDALEAQWREFETTAAGHVFQSFDWISTWYNTIGRMSGVTPLIVTGRGPDGRLIFLLPLGVARLFGVTTVSWLGGHEADLKCGLFDPAFLAASTDFEWSHLWQRIRALFPGVDLFHLSDQPERIGQARNPFVLWRTHHQPDRTHATHLGKNWEAYYAAKRGKESRRQDRRRERKLEAMGKLEFVIYPNAAAVPDVIDTVIDFKGRLLARMGVENPFDKPPVRNFMNRIAERNFPKGPVQLSAITLDGRPISVTWAMIANKRFYYLMSAYDREYAYNAPGTRHLQQTMRWCTENGIEYFDFSVGDQDYKFEWCEDHVPLFATIESASWHGYLVSLAVGAKARVKYAIKTSKTLWPLAQRVRTFLFSRARRRA